MKKYFIYSALIFASCNDGAGNEYVKPADEASELKKLVAKHPDSLMLRESLIQYYREAGKYDLAILEADTAVSRNRLDPRLQNIKAILYFENEDTLDAVSAAEKAVAIYPSPEYLVSLGTLYAQTKNSRALKVADILINQYKLKSEKDGLFIKGFYYTNINEKEKSIEYFNKVLALNYTYMEAYREKALALYSMQKFSEALAVLDKAVTLQNNFDEGFYYKGMVLEKLNRPEDAKEAYKRALIYDTGYVEAKAALKRLTLNNK